MEARILAPGAKITEPGVWDLTMDQYHGQPCDGPSVSSSGLRTIWSESPAHFWLESSLNPNRPEPDERPHFSLGRAAHHLLFLGRKGFDDEFVTRPPQWSDWRTKDAREWKASAVLAGKTVITDAELEHISGMARSLAAHPMVKAGILDGAVERSLIFKDQTGVWLKSRPDCIPNSSGDYADLKTSASVSTDSLQRSIEDFHYPMQGALVGMASKAVLGVEMQSFTLVFVEKAPPYCVRVVTLTPEDLLRGAMQLRAAIDIFAGCVESGEWPGPGGSQQDAEFLPMREFTRRRIDEQLELLKGEQPRHLHAAE
jgi:hypothetical protein